MILQAAVGKLTLTEEQKRLADINGDGVVNATDARLILQYVVEKIDSLESTTTVSATTTEINTTTTTTTAQPVPRWHLSQYPVREVYNIPEGTNITIEHIENLGHVPDWNPSEAAIINSVEELQSSGIELPDDLTQKYNAAFFQNHAVLLMAMPVGHANINHRIDGLVRAGDVLYLNTTIYWTEGADMTQRVTWRCAFEVSKADVAGVKTIYRYTYDERDPELYAKPMVAGHVEPMSVGSVKPMATGSYMVDDCVIITLKSAYSTVRYGVFDDAPLTPEDFPGLDVVKINLLRSCWPGEEQKYHTVVSLKFKTKSTAYVYWALSELKKMNIILYAEPDYFLHLC